MAILKAKDARQMDDATLLSRLSQVEEELLRERGQVKVGGRSSNPGRIKELRRTRARIITILYERAKQSQKSKNN
ncbi:MAG: 50S ribosomal protein L29 [Candidatus Anstonellales archaeon]